MVTEETMTKLKPVFKHVLTVADKSLQADRTVHGLEQQPCGVQVVEGVGLISSGFQFLLGLAAVFAEEVGCFWLF